MRTVFHLVCVAQTRLSFRIALVLLGAAAILRAEAQVVTFTDVTDTALENAFPLSGNRVALGDIENDGDLDIWVFNALSFDDQMFRNDGSGFFEDITNLAGVDGSQGQGQEKDGLLADYDNDGLPDAFVATSLQNNSRPNLFYENCDGLVFKEVGVNLGVQSLVDAQGVTWADIDRDGYLDIYVATIPRSGFSNHPFVYMNQGGVGFVDEFAARGIDYTGGSLGNLWFDWEEDGDPDLYLGAFFDFEADGFRDRLYHNDGTGHFTQVTTAFMASAVQTTGAQLADFDTDGRLDILVLNEGTDAVLWRDNGDGTFTDIAPTLNLEIPSPVIFGDPERKSSLVVGDLDNDMDPDVFVTWWDLTVGGEPRNQLWLREGDTYVERGVAAGITERHNTFACAAGDLNGDGFLDIYVVNDDGFGTRDTLYFNDGNANHWFEIDPQGVVSNRDAFGLRAWVTAGGVTQVQELYSYRSHPSRLHFGLASHEVVETLTLRWPNGLVETYSDLPADQVFRPIEGAATAFEGVGVTVR